MELVDTFSPWWFKSWESERETVTVVELADICFEETFSSMNACYNMLYTKVDCCKINCIPYKSSLEYRIDRGYGIQSWLMRSTIHILA